MTGPLLVAPSRGRARLVAVPAIAAGLLLGLVLALTGSSAGAAPGRQCTCQPPAGVGARAAKVSTVFTGQVVSQQVSAVGTGQDARQVRRYQTAVERVYQGEVTTTEVVVVSPAASSRCGLGQIPTGKTWVFFVNGSGAKFFGNTCQGSERATSALLRRIEQQLGSGHVVVEPAPEPPPLSWTEHDTTEPAALGRLLAPGAAATIVGLLGLVVVGRARRRPADGEA